MACGRQKVKGGHGSITASISTSIIASIIASIITLNLGVGCAPSCWPIFGFRNLLGARRGAEGSFLCSLITDFLAEGAGWGASPGRGGELGCQAQQVLKKNCEIGVGFSFAALSVFRLRRAEAASALWIPHWHSEPFESQGARAAKRWT